MIRQHKNQPRWPSLKISRPRCPPAPSPQEPPSRSSSIQPLASTMQHEGGGISLLQCSSFSWQVTVFMCTHSSYGQGCRPDRTFYKDVHYIRKDNFVRYLSNGTFGTFVALMEAELQQLLCRVIFGGFWALTTQMVK